MRRYAETTKVAISKSRDEIGALLREWGAELVSWADDFKGDQVVLRFVWTMKGEEDRRFHARLSISIPTHAEICARSDMRGARGFSETRFRAACEANGKSEHRLLLLWLKASFNAVAAGLVSPEALFLPFLEGKDGTTVAERAVPNLGRLLMMPTDRLLGAGQ